GFFFQKKAATPFFYKGSRDGSDGRRSRRAGMPKGSRYFDVLCFSRFDGDLCVRISAVRIDEGAGAAGAAVVLFIPP
ncbi:MAG: hypothetical protein IJK40_07380, partial [Clostridia bacterium]|nr:hypothetical protein [Clostridia bacterium]